MPTAVFKFDPVSEPTVVAKEDKPVTKKSAAAKPEESKEGKKDIELPAQKAESDAAQPEKKPKAKKQKVKVAEPAVTPAPTADLKDNKEKSSGATSKE